MAKAVSSRSSKSKKAKPEYFNLTFAKENYVIIGIGILLIILGYVFMAEKSVDGFMPTVIAPILLVLGYCVFVPVGILYNGKLFKKSEKENEPVVADLKNNVSVSSNIKTK